MDAELFDDDPGCLPKKFQPIYINPYKIFGINNQDIPNEKELIKIVRDKTRRAALGQCKFFWSLPQNKAPMEEILFAYLLIRRILVGPAQKIKAVLAQSNTFLDFRPEDLLPTLRPLQGVVETPSAYRAFRHLNITYSHAVLEMSWLVVPNYAFVINIHYCLRKHSIQRTYADMLQFHSELREELLTVPHFPEDAGSFSFLTDLSQALSWNGTKHRGRFPSRDEVGLKIACFLQRVHNSLAESGRFSPRLLRFLEIDFEKVQSEEEGAILQILDSQILPPRSCWYMIDEPWLGRWRRFAMGRGPRRYLPPGPISNAQLAIDMNSEFDGRRDETDFSMYAKNGEDEGAEKDKRVAKTPSSSASKKWLQKVVHYRCVNCNVWKFYQLVHGGGPVISRQDADIYSPYSVSYLQGVIMLQTRVRIMIARIKREELYTRRLSKTRAAQALLSKELDEMRKNAVTAQIAKEASVRLSQGLIIATQITQKLWRKKNNSLPEEKLAIAKRDQAIFNRSNRLTNSGRVAEDNMTKKAKKRGSTAAADSDFSANPGAENIISDVLPIVHIGNTSRYTRSLTDDENHQIPFKIKKLPWMEMAVIAESTDGHFLVNSKILSINGHPASSMTYAALRRRLGSHVRPMTLVLERPPKETSKRSLDDLMNLTDDRLRYSAFKIMLSNELLLIKHSISVTARSVFDAIGLSVVPTHHRTAYMTRLILTETDLYYKKRLDLNRVQSEHWLSVPLYSIKFILEGKEIDSIAKHGSTVPVVDKATGNTQVDLKAININLCFAIITETTEIILELPTEATSAALLEHERHKQSKVLEIQKKDLLLRGLDPDDEDQAKLNQYEKGSGPAVKMKNSASETPAAMLAKTKMVIGCLKMLVQEIKSSQFYVDKEGVPTLRRVAKKTLRQLNR